MEPTVQGIGIVEESKPALAPEKSPAAPDQPRASIAIPVRINSMKGWLAPVYVNDVFLMMTVDTGAAITMLNATMFDRHFPGIELQASEDAF